jgi:hypothetical protein
MRHALRFALAIFLAALSHVSAQTTQGLIAGRIINSVTGRPVSGATIVWNSTTLAASGTQRSDEAGYYFLPRLGQWSCRCRHRAALVLWMRLRRSEPRPKRRIRQ